jgi:hypothetical protein
LQWHDRTEGGDLNDRFPSRNVLDRTRNVEGFTVYKKKWKEFFASFLKELKSYKLLAQTLGGNTDGYVEMWEFQNLAELEKFFNKLMLSGYKK